MLRFCATFILPASVLILVTVTSSPARAADKKKLAMVGLRDVDADFSFQGEYLGELLTDTIQPAGRTTGLQVVAMGGGRFDAVLFPGGLPGQGWFGTDKVQLSGKRTGDSLNLGGGQYSIVVESDYALVNLNNGRPLGQIAKVHRVSSTLGALPPVEAQVLFEGGPTTHFKNARVTEDGLLEAGTQLKQTYHDYTLHVEFLLPYMPHARGQGRSNSGVYLQSRYEVQILDSFGLKGESNECGGFYKLRRPDVNMCLPPLSWQTYDIIFSAPRFDEKGEKIRNARISVWHNGVVVHNNVEVVRKTGGGAQEGSNALPIKLQHHHNPVRFRNIWIVDRSQQSHLP